MKCPMCDKISDDVIRKRIEELEDYMGHAVDNGVEDECQFPAGELHAYKKIIGDVPW